MLKLAKVCIGYKEKKNTKIVIEDMNFSLDEGKLLAVLGPSGCGKTTFLNSIATVLKPLSGTVTWKEDNLDAKSVSIGLIPQNYGLLPWKTVKENCLFVQKLHRTEVDIKTQEKELGKLLKELGIEKYINSYPVSLSGGQAQRVALARAFNMKPDLLLMDEPFSALDVAAALKAENICFSLWKEYHPTTIIITHRLEEAMFLANEIMIMGKGGDVLCQCNNPWQGMEYCEDKDYHNMLQFLQEILFSMEG